MIFKIKYYLERKQREHLEQKKILRKQLDLLAEKLGYAHETESACIAEASCKIYKLLHTPTKMVTFGICFIAVNFHFVICFLILVKKLFGRKTR